MHCDLLRLPRFVTITQPGIYFSHPPVTQPNPGMGVSSASGPKLKLGNFLDTGWCWPLLVLLQYSDLLGKAPSSMAVSSNLFCRHAWHLGVVLACPLYWTQKLKMWRLAKSKYIETGVRNRKETPGTLVQAKNNEVIVSICCKQQLAGVTTFSLPNW